MNKGAKAGPDGGAMSSQTDQAKQDKIKQSLPKGSLGTILQGEGNTVQHAACTAQGLAGLDLSAIKNLQQAQQEQ